MSLCKNTGWYGPIITMVMRGKDGKGRVGKRCIQCMRYKNRLSINMIKHIPHTAIQKTPPA